MVKNTIKLYRRLFLHETNKKMQRNREVKCFVLWLHDVTYAELKTLYDVTYAGFKTLYDVTYAEFKTL